MPIKFECPCGKRLKAADGSEGRHVRCPCCREKVAVPGPGQTEPPAPPGGSGLGDEVGAALQWQEERDRRRAEAPPRWLSPRAEQWLAENGVWVPAGIAVMALSALTGLASYAMGLLSPLPFCAFMFLVGLGVFLYGRYGED